MFLLRHGQAQMPDTEGRIWSRSGAALTPDGLRRASELATTLAGAGLEAVFTSDLHRARETADVIASSGNIPVIPDPRLRELDIGEFEGMTLPRLREVDRRFLPWLEVYFRGRHAGGGFHVPVGLPWPGGEAVADAFRRALPVFCEIAREWQGRTVAVCTHAYVLQTFLCHVVGADVAQYWSFAGLPASLTLAELGPDGRGVLRTMNGDAGMASLAGGRLPLRDRKARRDAGVPTPPADDADRRSTCRVFLARHGQSMAVETGEPVYSHHPIGLTTEGRRQAEQLASSLAPVRLDAVYTSDLNRARETAEPVAAAQGLTPVVLPELREISLGDFEGTTLERVHAEHERFVPWLEVSFNERFPSAEFHHPADLSFPGGESVLSVYERVIEPFLRIVRAHLGGTVAVVGHGWVLQPLLCHVIGAPATDYFRLQLRYAVPALVEVDADGLGVLEAFNHGTHVNQTAAASTKEAG